MTNDVIAIKNHRLKAEIDLFGGAFRSITDLFGGEELVWQGCENCDWKNHDHVLFPLVCRMKDGYYEHDGTRYESSLHGFAKDSVFTPEIVTETSATVLLKSDENTLKAYPFDFELRVEYEIADNGISVTYEVKNTGRETMPYFVGGHLGINLDGTDEKEYKNDTQGNFLEFIPPITSEHGLDGNFVLPPSPTFADNVELSKAYFKKVNTFIGITEGKQKAILTKKTAARSNSRLPRPSWRCGRTKTTVSIFATSRGGACRTKRLRRAKSRTKNALISWSRAKRKLAVIR